MIGEIISQYKILEQLGSGGMGVVYKALDLKLDRPVALKFLPPDLTRDSEARQRFILEAKAASSLQHANICVVYNVDETVDGQMFIVMEYLEGETVGKKIEGGPQKIDQALDISMQVAQGMAEGHQRGIIHRDLKPANILVTKSGVAKIVDFGLAKLSGHTSLTKSGSTLGTVAYMSPEQARGDLVDKRTDIWSLGVILYEMVTGQRPFRGEYDNAVAYLILNVEPEPMSALRAGIPVDLERIVKKCLSKDPRERYQHMDELLVDARSCARGTTHAGGKPFHPANQVPKRRALVALAVVGLISLAVVAYLLKPSAESPNTRLKKIAVLPLENLGPPEDEYFADGLTDEIASRLSSIHGLGVISRTSCIQYKKTSKTVPVIGRELGADYILEGTIRWEKTGSTQKIRITPRLIQVQGDLDLWADNIDGTLEDIFVIQTEIATRVVKSLDFVLGENETQIINAIPTKNLDAYRSYLRGLSFSDRIERPNIEMAMEMFGRAVELDSTFALAYAELSMANLSYFWFGYDQTKERLARAKSYLDRAFWIQNDLPNAYLALGYYYLWGSRDYDRALEEFAAAEKRLPNSMRALEAVAYTWRRQGKFEAAVKQLRKATNLDPQNPVLALEIGNTFRMLGRYAEAETYLDRSISLLPDLSDAYLCKSSIDLLWHGDTKKSRSDLGRMPAEYEPWLNLMWLDIYDRDYQSALDHISRAKEIPYEDNFSIIPTSLLRGMVFRFMNDSVRSRPSFDSARVYLESALQKRPHDYRLHKSLAIAYAGLERRKAAIREAELAVEQLPVARDAWAGVFPVITLAHVYTMVGMNDEALDTLDFLLSNHASREITVHILQLDPTYDPLRNNPVFQSLLMKYNVL